MRRTRSTNGMAKDGNEAANERVVVTFLERLLDKAVGELSKSALGGTEDTAVEQAFGRVMVLRRVRQAAEALAQRAAPVEAEPVYLVGSRFLIDTYRTLTRTPDEELVYATGPEDGEQAFAISELVAFKLAQKSRVGATPDPTSQLEALMELDRHGERLLAVLHSHPGYGAGGTTPSPDDRTTQQGLERMGYPSIGAIFSRDGFIRFFSVNRRFRVAVSGAGVEKAGDHIYHLTDIVPKSFVRRVVCRVSGR